MASLELEMVDYVELAGATIAKQAAALDQFAQREKEAAALIPRVVEAAVKASLVHAHEKAALATALADPTKALQYILNIAVANGEPDPGRLGRPAPSEKAASANSKRHRILSVHEPCAAADAAYMKHLGLG